MYHYSYQYEYQTPKEIYHIDTYNTNFCFCYKLKRYRSLTFEEIRAALEVDVPSGSDDERFGLSDDSYIDKNYVPPSDDDSEINICLEQDNENDVPEQVTLNVSEALQIEQNKSSIECERPTKRARTSRKI